VVRRHLPPRGAAIPRSFNSPAMALMETKPALRSLRIVGPRDSARTSAARLFSNPLLIPPPLGSATRLSILTTVVRCQLPPRAVAIPLRFNSFASSCWETRPAAISVRMVGTGKHWGSIRHHLASSLRSPKSRARTAGLQDKAHSRRPSDTRNAMTRLAEALSSVRRRNCSKVGASRWGLRAVSTATLALYISSDSRSGSS
jgi:hypothetical protein